MTAAPYLPAHKEPSSGFHRPRDLTSSPDIPALPLHLLPTPDSRWAHDSRLCYGSIKAGKTRNFFGPCGGMVAKLLPLTPGSMMGCIPFTLSANMNAFS